MNCPVCNNVQLVMSERQGIEIDYCPQCRGIWLDRGELDKIIERSAAEVPSSRYPEQQYKDTRESHYEKHDKHKDKNYGDHHGKKRGFLSDLFD